MSSPNGSPSFRVVTSGVLKQRIKTLHLEAAAAGYGPQFVDALRIIYERIGQDPRQFGDPQYRLSALRLTIFNRALFPIAVDYGAHDVLPFVVVRGFRLMI